MALVAAAAVLMAMLFLLFKVFDRRNVPLLPAIAVNYVVAVLAGLFFSPPWRAGDLSSLWLPAIGLGIFFVINFYFTGLSTQRAGVAATTVASRMSLVLTVIAAVVIYNEEPGLLGWLGIAFAIAGVALASLVKDPGSLRGAWKLPVLIFFGNAVIDITINWMQRARLDASNEAVFPTMTFMSAAVVSVAFALQREGSTTFKRTSVWVGGTVLGLVNYAALVMIVKALSKGGFPASSFYPLMNVGVILIGTMASMILFRERLGSMQVVGIALAIVALVLILNAQ